MIKIIFQESSTIGVRSYPVTKHMLQRTMVTINTIYGEIKIKVSKLGERVVNVTPEFESCMQVAAKLNVPVKNIYAKALGDSQAIFLDVGK